MATVALSSGEHLQQLTSRDISVARGLLNRGELLQLLADIVDLLRGALAPSADRERLSEPE